MLKRRPEMENSEPLILTTHNNLKGVGTHFMLKIKWCSSEMENPTRASRLRTLVEKRYGEKSSTCITSYNHRLRRQTLWSLNLSIDGSSTNSIDTVLRTTISSRRRLSTWFKRICVDGNFARRPRAHILDNYNGHFDDLHQNGHFQSISPTTQIKYVFVVLFFWSNFANGVF